MATQVGTVLEQRPDPRTRLLEIRSRRIRELAYLKAEKRGFTPGHELEDWRAAEDEVDEALRPLPKH